MDAKPRDRINFESRLFLLVWCMFAGLALAPLPVIHAFPMGYLYYLYESPPPGWSRLTLNEAYWLTLLGVSLAPIFLAWSLPGASRPGLPKRSIVILCLLIAYNPFRYYFESHFYGDIVARITDMFSRQSLLIWIIWRLDTPLLIGLAVYTRLRRHILRPIGKALFHWGLFVCALWAAGPLYDRVFLDIIFWSGFRR